MKKLVITLVLVLLTVEAHSKEREKVLNLSCYEFTWPDVESLVEPYLDASLYTALVMQGQSSNYKTSEAASMALAMDNSLPEAIQKILRSLVQANC